MSSIPISQIVRVNPGVLSAGGSAIDLNGLMLTQSALAPYGQALQFASADDVKRYFGSTSEEGSLATIYFNGFENATKKPGILLMARYPETAIAGFLISGALQGMTLAQLQALSGVLEISVGGVVETSDTINLATATSFSDAADKIEAAFETPGFSVVFDSTKNGFVFTTTATGVAATISYASGSLSAGLKLTQAAGAILSQGADATTPAAFMDGFVQVALNWAPFMTVFDVDLDTKKAFSAWSNANEDRFLYVSHDDDPNALIPGNEENFGFYLADTGTVGTQAIYGDATHAAFSLAFAASLDFTRLNGRATEAFKVQSGLEASVRNASDAAALEQNGYNFYGAYANAKQNWNFFYPGSVSGQWKWADSYLNQIWLNANLQLAMVNLLLSVNSIPYNDEGYGLVNAACMDPINQAINFGAIRVGVTLSESQKAQIQFALGVDAAPAITASGFYLQIVDAPPSVRAERQSPSMTLYYADGGSIQRLTLASIEVQ